MAVADEAGVELDGADHQRPHVFDKVLGHATAAQEDLRNLATRLVDGVNADGGRPLVLDSFKALRDAQVDVGEVGSVSDSVSATNPPQVRPAEDRPAEVRPVEF